MGSLFFANQVDGFSKESVASLMCGVSYRFFLGYTLSRYKGYNKIDKTYKLVIEKLASNSCIK